MTRPISTLSLVSTIVLISTTDVPPGQLGLLLVSVRPWNQTRLESSMAATSTSWSQLSIPPGTPTDTPRYCNEIHFFEGGSNTTAIEGALCPSSTTSAATSTVTSNTASSIPPTTAIIESSAPNSLPPPQTSLSSNPTGVASNSIGPSGKKGLEGGAVAGIAIGMLLAGVLIAGFICFFLLRRQKKRLAMSAAAYSRHQAEYTERNAGTEKGATVLTGPVGSIDDLLPQPAEDDAISGELSRIRDNIKNHVRTYYHSGPISAADINEVGIRDVAALTGVSAAALGKALEDPLVRDNALRSIVSSMILTRCTGERSPSLLPNDVAALSASIAASNGTNCESISCAQPT